jgi:hypothetical protein
MIKVTAKHSNIRWTLDDQEFALVEAGEFGDYRVGGDHANGYYSPAGALRDLIFSNGCTAIHIYE